MCCSLKDPVDPNGPDKDKARLIERSRERRDDDFSFWLLVDSEHTSEINCHSLGVKAQMQRLSGAVLAQGYCHNNISQPLFVNRVDVQEDSRIK